MNEVIKAIIAQLIGRKIVQFQVATEKAAKEGSTRFQFVTEDGYQGSFDVDLAGAMFLRPPTDKERRALDLTKVADALNKNVPVQIVGSPDTKVLSLENPEDVLRDLRKGAELDQRKIEELGEAADDVIQASRIHLSHASDIVDRYEGEAGAREMIAKFIRSSRVLAAALETLRKVSPVKDDLPVTTFQPFLKPTESTENPA